jgi:DNA primase
MDDVLKVKERIDIVEVIQEYVPLVKAGRNYKGLSPFKKEKTPSFFVSPEKGMYYDFSSGKGGDVFNFLQEVEGLDFRSSLEMLAERAGVKLLKKNKESQFLDKDEMSRLYSVLDTASSFFEARFLESKEAKDYVEKRGISLAFARIFRIGLAPSEEWHSLEEYLSAKGFSLKDILSAGLVKKNEKGNVYDRFRSRIIFPLFDINGRVIAFSGRIFGTAEKDEHNAKYLNSPETLLFNKSTVLYGIDKAKQIIRKSDCSLVVEGQMDLVLSHQTGYANTVATSGTALTETHLSLLSRFSKNVIFAFDSDEAGVSAVERASLLALKKGMEVKVVSIPLGKDPADCIKEDPLLWKKAVKNAQNSIDYILSYIEKTEKSEEKKIKEVEKRIIPLIDAMQSSIARGYFVRRIAEFFGIQEEVVWEDVEKFKRKNKNERKEEQNNFSSPLKEGREEEKIPSLKENIIRDISAILFWQNSLEEKKREVNESIVKELEKKYTLPLCDFLSLWEKKRSELILRGEFLCSEEETLPLLERMIARISSLKMEEKVQELQKKIRFAEQKRDNEEVDNLLKMLSDIQTQMRYLAE